MLQVGAPRAWDRGVGQCELCVCAVCLQRAARTNSVPMEAISLTTWSRTQSDLSPEWAMGGSELATCSSSQVGKDGGSGHGLQHALDMVPCYTRMWYGTQCPRVGFPLAVVAAGGSASNTQSCSTVQVK